MEKTIHFDSLGLSAPILQAIEEKGYTTPTPIQAQAIPAVLQGKDVMAAAQTGTGKTAGFTLPILEGLSKGNRAKPNQARVLILTPTRELAAQIQDSVDTYGKHLPLNSTVVFGGVKINPQMMKLRRGVDVLVATPGRLIDLYNQKAVRFKQLEVLVLDEADRMLDMGFIHDIRKILAFLPANRQTLMFSATFSHEIRNLAKKLVRNPVEISVTPRNTTVKAVKQWICPVDKKQKSALLVRLIQENDWKKILVFSRTKHGANRLTQYLEKKKIKAAAIHGNKSQNARTKALEAFKKDEIRVLVATDIAARGIDIDQLPQVINFDLPNVPEDYIHRIGRTGRAGAKGQAISLVSADEFKQLSDIEYLLNKILDRKIIDGFDPVNDVPVTRLDKRPGRIKKPKKPHKDHRQGQRSGSKGKGHNPRSPKAHTNKKIIAMTNPKPFKPPPKRFQPKGLTILYEDHDILVVDKVNGLLTVSTDKEKTKTAYFLLTDYVRKGNPKSKNRIFVVHRLDKDISGVLLFAKNEKSRQYLLDNWQQFSKKYSAVVHGKLTKKEGIITSYLAENSIHKMYSVQNPEKGVLAETGYKVIKESSKYSLLEINLLTSRKNQIRAHFSEKSCPIAGDKKYGEKQKGIKRLTLHAQAITFTHPYTKKMMTVEAKIPGYFYSLLSRE